MEWFPVESTDVAALGWESLSSEDEIGQGLMGVKFHKPPGATYVYFDVPRDFFEEFMAAPSKGQFANRVLKQSGFGYERVE
jgi:KTSC domain